MSRRAAAPPTRRLRAPPREPSPVKRATRAQAHEHDEDTKPDMVDDDAARAEAWADFAADHYEMIEQLPLELHRNSRLLRELDQESLAQQERLQAKIRGYVAYRLAVARAPGRPAQLSVRPAAEAEVEKDAEGEADADADGEVDAQGEPDAEGEPDADGEPDAEGEPEDAAETTANGAAPEAPEAAPEAKEGDETATQEVPSQLEEPPAATAATAAPPPEPAPAPIGGLAPSALPASPTPAATPAPPDEGPHVDSDAAEVHAVEDAAELALVDREATDSGDTKPPPRVPLVDIAQLVGDLVRNREEKVAIAIGAYNAIDRHIRALDSALSAHESSLLGIGVTPEVEAAASVPPEAVVDKSKRGKKKRKSGSVVPAAVVIETDVPPGIDADPNEPRYCYCNQVSYGEMVGCDNEDCPYEWFHLGCLGLKAAPQGAWLCENCRPGGGTGAPSIEQQPRERPPKKRKR